MEKEQIEQKPVVFWYARMLGNTIYDYHMIMDGEEANVYPYNANALLIEGRKRKYSMFCLN